MSIAEDSIVDQPVLFCLHYLGGSAREWAPVALQLGGNARCVPVDLPGFGDAAQTPGYTVTEMAAIVARAVRLAAPRRWILIGHSMGAKVATVLARYAEDGVDGLEGLDGLILLAGSPPGPEPMQEQQRETMMGWFRGDLNSKREQARQYIDNNSGDDMDESLAEGAAVDVLRANRCAWLAWFDAGSREDWSDRVGVVQMPTLVIAGELDENLGPDAQRNLMVPHFAHVRSVTLAGAKHLLPLERPGEVARLIDEHVAAIARERQRFKANTNAYRALIASDRVGSRTREVLLAREKPDDPDYVPVAINRDSLATLRAVLRRVVPQVGFGVRIDLAARIDSQLASGPGDGWRFAELPPDAEAYRAGLLTLEDEAKNEHGTRFALLEANQQDTMLARVAAGRLGSQIRDVEPRLLSPRHMQAWFDDLRSDAVKLYVAHPQTLRRIGYSGIANGGDGEPKTGFVRVGIGEREDWEPVASTGFAP